MLNRKALEMRRIELFWSLSGMFVFFGLVIAIYNSSLTSKCGDFKIFHCTDELTGK